MRLFVVLTLLGVAVASTSNGNAFGIINVNASLALNPQAEIEASTRITNGKEAAQKQFPYQAGLLLHRTDDMLMWCGGALISNRWVLTAAHCTDLLSQGVFVYLGAWKRGDASEGNQHAIFVATKDVIVHENYDPEYLFHDISLIKLPVVMELNDYVQPIKLPKWSKSYETYDGRMAITSGWGKLGANETSDPDILRWIRVPIMGNDICSRWFAVEPSMICINTVGALSACVGDSGGPLVLADDFEDGQPILIGLTSYGYKYNCEAEWPVVFTRTASYLDWIAEKTGVINA